MKLRLLILALLLVGCAPTDSNTPTTYAGNYILRYHDDAENVTCWILNSRAISCIPDWQLKNPNE